MAVKIIFSILLLILFVVMSSVMIIFERDKPRNIIVWLILFLLTSFVGGIAYTIFRLVIYFKSSALKTKQWEDDVYKNLINSQIFVSDTKTDDDFYNFNKMAFDAKLTTNNNYEFIDSHLKFTESLLRDIQNANSYIIIQTTKVNAKDFDKIKTALIQKAGEGVVIKFIYDRHNNLKMLKEMKRAGIKVKRFSKLNTINNVYSNLRNAVCVDGKIAYIGNMDIKKRELSGKFDVLNTYIKLKGDVVQDIDIILHEDVVFATNKFMEYSAPKQESYSNDSKIQYVTNHLTNNIELLLVKAISLAKSSIQLQLDEFIPTESIMSLLRFAMNSNIAVNLMVPLKTNKHSKYYASRAYAKELALMGANVYLYDGYMRYNAITIDNKYVLFGSFVLDREHISLSLQNVLVIEDNRAVNYFNKAFSAGVENSYRIANAKYMLLRERFFKNFV